MTTWDGDFFREYLITSRALLRKGGLVLKNMYIPYLIKTSPSFRRNARLVIRYSLKKSPSQVVTWPPTVSTGLMAVISHGSVVFIMAR